MDFREKIINDLKNAGVDVTPNNFIDDLFIKKYLSINTSLNNSIEAFPDKLSFKNFEKLNQEDNEKFAGNFFVEIADGKKAIGIVRLFFDTPVDSFIAEETVFSTDEGLRFLSTQDQNIESEEMASNTSGMYYYQEVQIEAESIGDQYNVDPGDINNCSNQVVMSRVVMIENPYKFSNGLNPESSNQLYDRVKDSISVRNLANNPSINSILKNNFQTIIMNIFPVRTGHDLMFRDIINIGGTDYRVGNMFDIWTETSDLTEYTAHINKDGGSSTANFGFSIDDLGADINEEITYDYTCTNILTDEPLDKVVTLITEVNAVDGSGEITEEISDVTFEQEDYHSNSVRQQSYLDFTGTTYESTTSEIQVKFLASANIHQIQKFVNDENNRFPVGDPLIKHFEILPLYGTIYYKGDIEEINMQEAITNFLKYYHYNPNRAEEEVAEGLPLRRIIEISDIVGEMIRQGAEKVKLDSLILSIDLPDGSTDTFNDEYKILPYQMILPQVTVARE